MTIERETCISCHKGNLTNNEVGLCKKLLGRKIERFFCIDCLAEYLEITVDDLNDKIDEFKGQGCVLFD